jgi:hypothetical protein
MHPSLAFVCTVASSPRIKSQVVTPPQKEEISKDGDVTITWRDEGMADVRDIVLVAVGGLLGIAGACLVEFVKALPGMRERPPPSTA